MEPDQTKTSAPGHRGSWVDSTWALAALLAITTAIQLFMAYYFFGFLTGDDVEVAAEAFRVGLGFRYRAWDIRNLFVPDFLVAPPLRLAWHLGVESVRSLIVAATIPSILANAITTVLLYRIAKHEGLPPLMAASLYALHWIPLGFGSTVYPRNVSTTCVVAAFYLLRRYETSLPAFLAGALMGLAFADRFSEVIFLVGILIVAGRRAVVVAAAFMLAVCVLVGAYDYVTWGQPFGSLIGFTRLTLVEADFASRVKHQGPLWYLLNLPRWLPLTVLPFLWKVKWTPRMMYLVLLPLAVLSLMSHKELRYVHGLIPWLSLLTTAGVVKLQKKRLAVALLTAAAVWELWGLHHFARKSMPAVEAAMMLGADPSVQTIVLSQLWAYGDRLYFTDRKAVIDVGTPPRLEDLQRVVTGADAVALYKSQLTPEVSRILTSNGFRVTRVFRHGPAREVVVFRRVR